MQKGLWPEGPDPLHLILLHPPGGIAAGDSLRVDIEVSERAHALVTTPGAGRWYRADALASQRIRLAVADDASLEWLPQETIVHDGALGEASLEIELSERARSIGWEITVFGRHASGERFERGELRQTTRLLRGGLPLFEEASLARGGLGDDPASLAGMHVSGLLWACAPREIDPALAESAELAMLAKTGAFAGASRIDGHLLLARVVESSPERARAALGAAWQVLRPALLGRAGLMPRIWAT